MNCVAPVISFHDYMLFDVYRQGLEHVSNIGHVSYSSSNNNNNNNNNNNKTHSILVQEQEKQQQLPPVSIKKSVFEEDESTLKEFYDNGVIEEMEIDELINYETRNWAIDPVIEEKQEKHIIMLEQQQKELQQLQSKQDLYAKEYALIKQLEESEGTPRLYDYTTCDVIETASAHCEWLLENDICVDKMNNTNRLLRKNLEFELLCQDKRSVKIVTQHDRFTELTLREDVSEEYLRGLIAQTYETSLVPEKDKLLIKCLEPKKRGRTSDADRLKTINIIDALKKESITPKKVTGNNNNSNETPRTDSSPEIIITDKYRVFLALLKFAHENAQTDDNYGAYLEKINKIVRMSDIDWPMQTLMRSILNMETCLGINEIESIAIDETEGPYYCSYSGDRIKNGDNVYHIRILEYSHERHKKWRLIKNRPNREFESPEFMESVRAFFVKKSFISLAGLWHRDFDDAYKETHSNYFNSTPESPVKTKRRRQRKQETSRIKMNQDGHVWQRMDYMRNYINQHALENIVVRGKTFKNEVERIHTLLSCISDTHSLQLALCDIISAYYKGENDDPDVKMAFVNRLMYVLLDFIDLFFTVSSCEDGTHRLLTSHDSPDCALRLLLDVSYQRRTHPSYTTLVNEFEKIDREATDVNHYEEFNDNNFLFLSVFDYFFPAKEIKKESEAIEVLHMFGL